MKNFVRLLVVAAFASGMIFNSLPALPAAAFNVKPEEVVEENLSPTTRHELMSARKATAKYSDISQAIADGYADINVFIPNMGFHYLRADNLDGEFDPERPELLVYAQDLCEGRMRLVAVEYAIPTGLSATAPEGFTGNADEWHKQDNFGLWTLHAWIWFRNPDGVFAELNPRVP